MFEEYFILREVGHGKEESLRRTISYLFKSFSPLSNYDGLPFELKLEKYLCCLEKRSDKIDFQSLTDIVNCPSKNLKDSRSSDEYTLGRLHQTYYHDRKFLSEKQIRRYESLLKKIPSKCNELLKAIQNEDLSGYEQQKIKLKRDKKL